ncbi:uroporphyrinogen-III synthase [Vogesella sp. LIG4]|uniref:uroporphyrinogen-III synthase n=1 Tax=Vogesella sp. LIG4 TaxID=1192162 RepID=UPI00081FC673|nr:uroporphyrinogen-III synthase [Vogesella sp. LIG4]SCK13443.1 uroporphyrinogen-III synthase [Vogesella sp. LIG4]
MPGTLPPTLLLVRPQAQALRQQAELAALGISSLPFCALDTVADAAALAALPRQAAGSDGVIFVSPSAIDIGWPAIAASLPPHTLLACVGAGSAGKLAAASGRTVIAPDDGNDSDALLAQPALQQLAGQRWLIVRGADGRAQLGATLAARGAAVAYADIYRREPQPLDWALFEQLRQHGALAGLLVASSEAASALFAAAGATRQPALAAQVFFTLHPRIAERLRQLGARDIRLCDGGSAALAAMLHG